MSSLANFPDIFSEAKEHYDVLTMWVALGIPGEPKVGMNFSPFRDRKEKHRSFSIYDGGQKWKDFGGEGGGGDCLELAKAWRGFSGPELREWLGEQYRPVAEQVRDRLGHVPADWQHDLLS